MNEQLFQFIWQQTLFRPEGLKTNKGDPVTVLNPGRLNTNSGPDFLDGRVKIEKTVWAGNIELHLKSSDWKRHNHDTDPAYQNIILHVVLVDDTHKDVANCPTLVLANHISEEVIEKYQNLMSEPARIPCHHQITSFPKIKWQAWLNRLLAERWEIKLEEWEDLWEQSGRDWRELLYLRMAANFGFHVNRTPFLQLAQSLPLKVLGKHRKNLVQIEALIFGQSGLLTADVSQDDYMHRLQKEYNFMRRKYELVPIQAYQWRFMRMRPANFPTIRLAQFAMLIHKSLDLFSQMMGVRSEKEILSLLNIQASDYWNTHYRFGEESKDKKPRKLGREAIRNIIINTVAPMQFLYAKLQGANNLIETSTELLATIPPERNRIVREWRDIGIVPKDAAETQALIQLYNHYCQSKSCLNCSVGNFLLQRSPK